MDVRKGCVIRRKQEMDVRKGCKKGVRGVRELTSRLHSRIHRAMAGGQPGQR